MRQHIWSSVKQATIGTAIALFIAAPSLAQQPGSNSAPARPLAGMELYLASNPKTEVEARAVLMRLGGDLYARGEFAEIDQVAGQFLRGRSRTPSGLWKLAILGAGIGSQAHPKNESEEAWEASKKRVRAWIEKAPKSPSAHIEYANQLIGHAWFVRGRSYAKDVRPEAWPRFRALLQEAVDALQASKSFASADPRWYSTMLNLATYQQWDKRKFDNLFKEAMKREPGFYSSHFAGVVYYTPKWGGSNELMEKYIKDSMRFTEKTDGNAMYARIYWYISQVDCDCDLFSDTNAFWPQLRQSFETVIRQYPDDWNVNHFAKFACEARDFAKVASLLERLNGRIVQEAWGMTGVLQRCVHEIEQIRIDPRVSG